MADLRDQIPNIFQPYQTMQQFMWQPNMLQVAKFLDAGMKRLQTVDPRQDKKITSCSCLMWGTSNQPGWLE